MKPILFHISNLHCSSCVQVITAALGRLTPPPVVEVSIASKTVTVYLDESPGLSGAQVSNILADEGFEVTQTPSNKNVCPQNPKHLENCALCRREQSSPPSSSALKLTMSVGGMTCSACSASATRAMSIPGVRDISVSLLDNSAVAVVDDECLVGQLTAALEDCGFDAVVINIEPTVKFTTPESLRTVSLRVDGMFCSTCPKRILDALETLEICVTQNLTIDNPVLTLSYRPSPPLLTIRSIIMTVQGLSSHYKVSVWHPPTAEERSRVLQRTERQGYLLNLCFTLLIAIPTFIIGIVFMTLVPRSHPVRVYLSGPMWLGNVSRAEWTLFFLASPVFFWTANVFHRRAIKEIFSLWRPGSKVPFWRRFIRFGSMNMLVSSGVSVAYCASVVLLALKATQGREDGMEDSVTYFDSVVFLTLFLLGGRYLEAVSKSKTSDAISSLASLRPEMALIVSDPSRGECPLLDDSRDLEKADPASSAAQRSSSLVAPAQPVSAELLEVGDIVRIVSGSSPPVDGVIVQGQAGLFDESSLTGESKPIKKLGGESVFAGTINVGAPIHIKVTNIGGTTMLDHIIQIVREGQTRRAPMERVADVVTGYFVPVVTLLAVLTWLVWLSLGLSATLPADYLDTKLGGWPFWSLEFAIAVFVVACPCGIGLAAPTALLVGSGLAAKLGILARGGGEAFQEMSQVDVVVFDKTGTLTEGQPTVSNVEFRLDGLWDREIVLSVAAELEAASSHVVGKAIRQYCLANGPQRQHGSNFEEVSGRGLRANFDDIHATAIVGNAAWMEEHNVRDPDQLFCTDSWKMDGKTVIFLALRDNLPSSESGPFFLVAAFAVTDQPRPEATKVIHWLQERRKSIWMLSGDHPATAAAIARLVGIPSANVLAGVLPHEKASKIQSLQRPSEGKRTVVAMVGDGINDSPALTVADVGIAIGSGSEVAISSASFILLSSSLNSVPVLLSLSKCIIRRVKFNFAWAMIYNTLAIPVASGLLFPAGHVRLNPVWASLAMALSSLSVICSSLMLKFYKPPMCNS